VSEFHVGGITAGKMEEPMHRTVAARVVSGIAILTVTLAANLLAQDTPAETGKLTLSVEYTGKGTVDKDHRVWIWVFDNPDSSTWAGTTPLSIGMLSENNTAYKFAALPKQVYFATAYDEQGGYDGTAGPPPTGTPIAIYGMASDGAAAPVATGGDDAALKFTFDDSFRMP
jgi:hypothetical protein